MDHPQHAEGRFDPLATGLLPLCFGEATKIAGLLLGSRKAYDTVAVLGTTTDTDDADGMPLREIPADEDVAESIVFFCSDRSRFVTGETLMVNSGEIMR